MLVALVFAGLSGTSSPLVGQSLTDAMISAYRYSPELASGRAALRGTDEGVAQALAATRPSLTATATGGATFVQTPTFPTSPNWTQSATLTLSAALTLWDGGDSDLAIEVAAMSVTVGRATLIETEQRILLSAVSAFMDMRRDARFLDLAENNRTVIARQVQAARDRFEVGEIRRTDVSLAEARLAAALSTVALRQGTLEISREAYHVSTGHYPGALQTPPNVPGIPATLAAAKSIAMRQHPSVKRAKYLARIAELNVFRAEAAMKPRVTMSATYGINANAATGDTASVGLTGVQPIYQGGGLTSARRQARALREQARADIQLAGLLVGQNVTRFWAQLQIARASITARQKEVRSARVALRGMQEEAKLGARTTLDVLDAERARLEAETNLVAAKRDEYVAVYSLLSSMGLLTVKHLHLGIATYEPDEHYKKVYTAPGPTDRGRLLQRILKRAGKK